MERSPIADCRRFDVAGFSSEPTLLRKIFSKTVRFEALAIYPFKYAFPAPGCIQSRRLFEFHTCLRRLGSLLQFEPKETIRSQSEPVGLALDRWEVHVTEDLDRNSTFRLRQIEIHRLSKTREIRDAQHPFISVLYQVGEYLSVGGIKKLDCSAPKDGKKLSQRNHVPHPIQERGRITLLGFHVDRFISPDRIHDDGAIEACGDRRGKAGVAIRVPLHGSTDAIAVTEVNVITHADFVAVVEDGRDGKGKKKAVEQFNAPAVVVDQGGEAPPDSQVDAHSRVRAIGEVHVVALVVCYHLECQLVVIPQQETPLTCLRKAGSLGDDVDDW